MSRLLDDLFIHTLKELGHIPVNLKEQYSRDIFENILRPIRHYVQTIGIHFNGPPDIPNVLIHVDEQRLEQVLTNLITNALKHTTSDDAITVEIDVEDQLLKVLVMDTGKGMLPQDMPLYLNVTSEVLIIQVIQQLRMKEQVSDYQFVNILWRLIMAPLHLKVSTMKEQRLPSYFLLVRILLTSKGKVS